MGKRVTLSIVTYNSREHIPHLLDSFARHLEGLDYQGYLIDNASTDDTLEQVAAAGNSRITVIANPHNPGFGQAHNQALPYLDSDYHIIVNPDITLQDDVVQKMADYMDAHRDIVLLTPKVLFPDGRLQVLPKRDPRWIYLLARRVNLPFLRKWRDRYEMAEKNPEEAFDIEFATGAFMFLRTDVYQKVGGFDPRFFLYFEDADLSRQLRAFGRAQYNPAFTVYHSWERAGAKSLKYLLIQISSMFRYLHKWQRGGRKAAAKRED